MSIEDKKSLLSNPENLKKFVKQNTVQKNYFVNSDKKDEEEVKKPQSLERPPIKRASSELGSS